MFDLFQSIMSAPTLTWVMAVLMTGSVCWFLKSVAGSTGLAVLFAPLLLLGALTATRLLSKSGIQLHADKDADAAAAAAIGIFVTLLMLLVVYAVWSSISDARAKARKVAHPLDRTAS